MHFTAQSTISKVKAHNLDKNKIHAELRYKRNHQFIAIHCGIQYIVTYLLFSMAACTEK